MSSDYGVKFAFGVQSVDQDLSTSGLMFTMYRGNEFYGEYGVANARNPSSTHEEWFGLTTLKRCGSLSRFYISILEGRHILSLVRGTGFTMKLYVELPSPIYC